MNGFAKDILLVDFEGTGIVLDESEPTQLGAILLDKHSLEEKDSFVSYIAIDHPDKFAQEAIEISGITPDVLKGAPAKKEVADKFLKQFGTTPFLASWNTTFDQTMMRVMMKSIGKDIFEFDYHYLDVWPVVYTHLAQHGHGDIVRLEPTLAYFGLKARGKHDALEDCRVTADVLRKVYFAKE